MKKLKAYFLIWLFTSIVFSCSDKKCEEIPNTSDIKLDLKVERLDKTLGKINSPSELKKFFSQHPELRDVFSAQEYPNDSIFLQEFFKTLSNPHVDTVFQDVEKVYADFSKIEDELEDAFKNTKYYYPKFIIPKVKTIASGFFSPDLFFRDSTIYIALDYFTGRQGHYPPPGEPDYIAKRYTSEYLVPTIMRVISTQFNATDILDKTLLAEMIYWGKSYYFVNKVMPCTADSLIIGFTQKQLKSAAGNQEAIWAHFIQNQLLFETNHFVKTKYIGDRPYTAEISSKCPGRIGQWLGWKIVNKFVEEQKDYSLQRLMAIKSANEILTKSKFKPKSGEGL